MRLIAPGGHDTALATPLLATLVTAALVELYRRAAWRLDIVDEPGGRRLHERRTPRGGGIVISMVYLVAAWVDGDALADGPPQAQTLAAAGMAWLGFWDDVRPAPAWLRLLVQVLVLGSAAALWLAPSGLEVAPVWLALAVAAALFTVNAFNFIDGADGLVSLQALAVVAGLHVCLAVGGHGVDSAIAAWDGRLLLFAACLLGFLPANWPRARLFLGDSGAYLVGTVCVGAALQAIAEGRLQPAAAAALFVVAWVDPAWTLLRRLLRRAPLLQSHLEHGYHRLLLRRVSHIRLSAVALAYTALWSTPIAVALQLRAIGPAIGVALAVAPMLALVVAAGAGRPWEPESSASPSR